MLALLDRENMTKLVAWPSWLMAIGNIGNWWNDLMDTSIYRKPCAFLYLKKTHMSQQYQRHETWAFLFMIELHIFWGIRYTIIIIIIIVIIIIIIIELCFSVFLLSILQLYSFTSLAQSCRPLPVPQHRCNGARHGLFLDSFRLALSKLDIQELLQRPTASKKARRLGAQGATGRFFVTASSLGMSRLLSNATAGDSTKKQTRAVLHYVWNIYQQKGTH